MTRLLLVRHATTTETRRAEFPSTDGATAAHGCPPLDGRGREEAARLGASLPATSRCWSSLARRAVQTAVAAGCPPGEQLPALAEAGFGSWAGHTIAEIHDRDPAGLAAWLADPDTAPHRGEALAGARRRARAVLDRAAALGGSTLAFTHGGFVKATVLEALGLPAALLWSLDVAPCSVTELSCHDGRWRLARLNWTPALPRARAGRPAAVGAGS